MKNLKFHVVDKSSSCYYYTINYIFMPIYPQLQGDVFRDKNEDEDMEKKSSDREIEWKRQLEQEKKREIVEKRIKQTTGPALPISREGGEEPESGRESTSAQSPAAPRGKETSETDSDIKSEAPKLSEMETPGMEPQKTEMMAPAAEQENESENEEGGAESDASPRERGFARSLATQQKNPKGDKDNTGSTAAMSPISIKKQASAGLLKAAWLSILTSFGLTLFYIAFHFVGAYVARMSWFCKFGEEWIPPQANIAVNAEGSAGTKLKKGIEQTEILLFFLCITVYLGLIFLLFFLLMAPIFVVYQGGEYALDTIKTIIRTITFGLVDP